MNPLDINPLISQCEIKVFYVGENRNHTIITKEVASEMAKTLRGTPIVGYYNENKGDYEGHEERITIDNEGIKFECLTKPYGFVAPDAKIWFQKFLEYDDSGQQIEREYLMTTGYLWTGQFEEAQAILNEGRPESMELDEETLKGKWTKNSKTNIDFFIINDAIFSKLCILGEDVEPCFEGADITSPNISAQFTKSADDNFRNTLYTMMQELRYALEGGQKMENTQTIVGNEMNAEVVNTNSTNEEVAPAAETIPTENDVVPSDYEKKPEEKDDKETSKNEDSKDKETSKNEAEDNKKKEDYACKDDEENKKYQALQTEFTKLSENFKNLQKECQELLQFKAKAEDEKKDNLIGQFYMLSDDDEVKKDVTQNKSKYSLEEIESKLSVACFRKKVNFDLNNNQKNDKEIEQTVEQPAITYSLESVADSDNKPEWLKAVDKKIANRK